MSNSSDDAPELDRLREDCERFRRERDQYRLDLERLRSDTDSVRATQAKALQAEVSGAIRADFVSWLKRQGAIIGVLLTIATAGGVIKLWDVMSSSVDKQVGVSAAKAVESHRATLKTLDDDAEKLRNRILDSLVEFKDQARKVLNEIEAERDRVVEHGRKTREEITQELARFHSTSEEGKQTQVSVAAPPGAGLEILFGVVPPNVVAIAAASADQVASDGPGFPEMGLFSQEFQRALISQTTDVNSDGVISWWEAVQATLNSMAKKSQGQGPRQTPVIEGIKSNEGLFATMKNSAVAKRFTTARALLVGINEYKGGFNLQGAVNDVRGFAKLVSEKNRVLAKDTTVTLLTDRQATKSAILDQASHLIDASGPEDMSIIYFSGHVLVEGQKEKHKSVIPHDYEEGATGVSIPELVKELGRAKGVGLIIVDG